ncbi:MAG TPA: histidine kinase dimerization/phosphoacceptor domain-containing protein, partial [Egibacteraceae bacterium]
MARTQTLWDRVAAIDPRVLDGLLVLVLALVEVVVVSSDPTGPASRDDGPALLTLLVTTVPLVWRRRAPLVVLGVVAAALALAATTGFASSASLSLSLAAYTAAAYRRPDAWLTAALVLAAAAGALLGGDSAAAALVGAALRVGVPAALGLVVADRRRWIARDRAAAAQAAVAEERARIARELHDVVMHTMGIMVVQAGAARSVVHKDPDAAAAALREVEEAGRTGVAELRRLLEAGDDDAGRAPQPGLSRLDELVERFRSAGLPVDVAVEGEPVP